MGEERVCPCCGGGEATRTIQVRGVLVGVIGLEAALEKIKGKGVEDEQGIKEELLREISARNYVPEGFEEDYKEALLKEYRAFLAQGNK